MPNIYDCDYKKLFSNKVIFRQLMETFVTESWVKELDFDNCETVDKSFISDHYKETESDIIYKTRLKDQDVYIFILIEFQSTVDRFMALRMLNYITNFYMDYIESNPGVKMLPSIFPILLYNGDAKWTASVQLSDLIYGNEQLGKYGLRFEYFKIAENECSKEELLKIRNIVSTLFLTESYYEIELLVDEFLSLFDRESDKEAVSLFLNWFKQLSEHGKVEKLDYQSLKKIYTDKEEVKTMLITAMEKEKKAIFEKGMEQGLEKAKLETAYNLLLKGFEISIIAEVTGLDAKEIMNHKKKDKLIQ